MNGGINKWVGRQPQRVAVKLAVQAAKSKADRRWGERLGNDLEGKNKMFWKEVK